ncbi:hypothetical protein CPB86DRAFT_828781 [Serendipita vermifera]|nr:hypothetical protein CPB86DRAFT_828781 [Serendipita vermifera]
MRSLSVTSLIFTLITLKNATWTRAQFADSATECTLACIERSPASGCTPGERACNCHTREWLSGTINNCINETCPGAQFTTDSFGSTLAGNWYCNLTIVPQDCEYNWIVRDHTPEQIRYCHMLVGDYTSPTPHPSDNTTLADATSTFSVLPSDERIVYSPADAWVDTSTQPGVGNCNNGTKATNKPDAGFTFTFKGTEISLYIVPSSHGGSMSVQIDGAPASTLSTSSSSAGAARDQCSASPVFSVAQLEAVTHQLIVKNGLAESGSGAGTLELSGIKYVGEPGGSGSKNAVSRAITGSPFVLVATTLSFVGMVL